MSLPRAGCPGRPSAVMSGQGHDDLPPLSTEQQEALAQFLAITGDEEQVARHLLEACGWDLESAVDIHMAGGAGGADDAEVARRIAEAEYGVGRASGESAPVHAPSAMPIPTYEPPSLPEDDGMRAALPQRIERLVDHAPPFMGPRAFRGAQHILDAEAMGLPPSAMNRMFAPPTDLLTPGSFDQAKMRAEREGKWLLANLQRGDDFASHVLNRNIWTNDHVKEVVRANFSVFQVDARTEEGRMVTSYYRVEDFPVVLVIEPATGQLMKTIKGAALLDPSAFMETLVDFIENGPEDTGASTLAAKARRIASGRGTRSAPVASGMGTSGAAGRSAPVGVIDVDEDDDLAQAIAMSEQDAAAKAGAGSGSGAGAQDNDVEIVETPRESPGEAMARHARDVPPEPPADDPGAVRVAIKLPSGKREVRRFKGSDTLKALYAFCRSVVPEAATGRAFVVREGLPGAPPLPETDAALDTCRVAGAMLMVSWDD